MISILQIILIISLIVIIPLGFLNMKKIQKKKELDSSIYSDSFQTNILNENEEKAKKYIEMYKSQYPRESVKAGVINMGITDIEAENYLDKYF